MSQLFQILGNLTLTTYRKVTMRHYFKALMNYLEIAGQAVEMNLRRMTKTEYSK